MRLRTNAGVAALAALALGACDTTPRVENASPAADTTATATATTPGGQRSDGLVTTTIQAKFFASPDVKGHQIDVDTHDGVVTLKGGVDSDQQRQTAEQIARGVEGVARVDNQLAVRPASADTTAPGAPGSQHHAPAVNPFDRDGRSPAWITSKIQSQFYLNPELKPWKIDVDTSSSGIVTLRGAVDSESDRAEALRIARSTEGVTSVADDLRVEAPAAAASGVREDARQAAQDAGGAIEDAWITTKIQSKYFVDDDVRARNIDVDTKAGMVTLKGTVESEGERQQAVSIAKHTDGVTMVHDNLVVDRAMGRSARDTSPRGTAGTTVDDAWITMKVQSKYYIHEEIKSRDVNVDTRAGVVTLNGTVPTEGAKKAAEVIAQDTDGVTRVVNNLKVGS
jgi:osmotically-inducible protein OsmY